MTYLIGGAPRVGKSKLAQMLLKRQKIAFVSLDSLVHMLKQAAPNLNVTDEIHYIQKAESFYPFLKEFIFVNKYGVKDYCIEGDAFLPKQAFELNKLFEVKSVFLGISKANLKQILENQGFNDWLGDLEESQLQKLPEKIMEMSEYLKKECQKYNLKYFDLAQNYNQTLEQAYDYLIL
ncbi:hypothetical protein HY025_00520 [Candidatus Daviesbacteria bacterium]|nr:hypothetical protein [Candidatus Daviesbacteria bacterium]